MRQARSDLNADSTGTRKNRRPALTVIAGLVALAIAAVVVVEERGGTALAGNDPSYAGVMPIKATRGESGTSITNTMSATDSAKPHFERSDEPANDEDSVHPYGG